MCFQLLEQTNPLVFVLDLFRYGQRLRAQQFLLDRDDIWLDVLLHDFHLIVKIQRLSHVPEHHFNLNAHQSVAVRLRLVHLLFIQIICRGLVPRYHALLPYLKLWDCLAHLQLLGLDNVRHHLSYSWSLSQKLDDLVRKDIPLL